MKYKDWLVEWLDNYIKPTSKMRTFDRYAYIVRLNIIPMLGDYDLSNLPPAIIQKFITNLLQSGNKKTGKGLAANSVNSIINVIQSSLRTAFNIGYIKEYSADKIKRPKSQEKQIECFSITEQKRIEQAVLSSKKDKLYRCRSSYCP